MTRRSAFLSAAIIVGALMASGCGFQPMYATSGFRALPGLDIVSGDTRQDYLIEQALDRFLGEGRSTHRLVLETEAEERSLGLSAADRASRFALTLTTDYILTGGSGAAVNGSVSEVVYFDAPSDPYALLAARADAEERAADLIARSIVRDISATLERRAGQGER